MDGLMESDNTGVHTVADGYPGTAPNFWGARNSYAVCGTQVVFGIFSNNFILQYHE